MFKFKLGLQVRDTKTGFVGVIEARTEYRDDRLENDYMVQAIDGSGEFTLVKEDRLVLCYGD